MIEMNELNPNNYALKPEIMANLIMLYDKINDVRKKYDKPMTITSGIRSKSDHIRIYQNIALKKGVPFDINKVPMSSNHLHGLACDVYDPDDSLKRWIMRNLEFCKKLGFYFESFRYTPNWVHFQIVAPKSGRRFFIP